MNLKKLPTYFLSHGGGPWPWMKNEMPFYDKLETSLAEIPKQIGVTPKAVLMISAHWEERDFGIMANPNPPMIYDYSGFPPNTYQIIYPAPGHLELAQQVHDILASAGLKSHLDKQRGFDHGSFVPLFVIYPNANVPVVQVSLHRNYDPLLHLNLGRLLKPLREQGVLILASGLSFHNLGALFSQDLKAAEGSVKFDHWLQETLLQSDFTNRTKNLTQWELAPGARLSHPREDHLIPLMVAVGAAEDEPGELIYGEILWNHFAVSGYRFGS